MQYVGRRQKWTLNCPNKKAINYWKEHCSGLALFIFSLLSIQTPTICQYGSHLIWFSRNICIVYPIRALCCIEDKILHVCMNMCVWLSVASHLTCPTCTFCCGRETRPSTRTKTDVCFCAVTKSYINANSTKIKTIWWITFTNRSNMQSTTTLYTVTS